MQGRFDDTGEWRCWSGHDFDGESVAQRSGEGAPGAMSKQETNDLDTRVPFEPLVRQAEHDPIVGHKTFDDGDGGFRHEPLRASEAEALWAEIEEADRRRAEMMPDEQSALRMMFEAWQRLKELGWSEAIYCPKDGSEFDAIEAGSTGIHRCHYEGKWPDGHWWIADHGDLWPSRPILYRK